MDYDSILYVLFAILLLVASLEGLLSKAGKLLEKFTKLVESTHKLLTWLAAFWDRRLQPLAVRFIRWFFRQ